MNVPDIKSITVNEVTSRLQILITISALFPILSHSFFEVTGRPEAFSIRNSHAWWLVVALYLVDYVFFEMIKSKISTNFLIWNNRFALIGVSSFILPFIIFALGVEKVSNFIGIPFSVSLAVVIASPLIIFFCLVIWLGKRWYIIN